RAEEAVPRPPAQGGDVSPDAPVRLAEGEFALARPRPGGGVRPPHGRGRGQAAPGQRDPLRAQRAPRPPPRPAPGPAARRLPRAPPKPSGHNRRMLWGTSFARKTEVRPVPHASFCTAPPWALSSGKAHG